MRDFNPVLSFQGGDYGTDEEEEDEMSPTYPSAIEVFDLAENEDTLSPVEVDPEKLAHKYKEVRQKHFFPERTFLHVYIFVHNHTCCI